MKIDVVIREVRRVELTADEVTEGREELARACREGGCASGDQAFAQIRFPVIWKVLCGKTQ